VRVGEDFAISGPKLVGAGSEHFHDDVWSFPWWGELAAVLVALDEAEHIALGHLLEGPNQIEPPDREWPRDGDRLECLGW
jgi:hypothetical protein